MIVQTRLFDLEIYGLSGSLAARVELSGILRYGSGSPRGAWSQTVR